MFTTIPTLTHIIDNESGDNTVRQMISLRKNFKYTTKIKHQSLDSKNIDLNFARTHVCVHNRKDKYEPCGFEQVDKTGLCYTQITCKWKNYIYSQVLTH